MVKLDRCGLFRATERSLFYLWLIDYFYVHECLVCVSPVS